MREVILAGGYVVDAEYSGSPIAILWKHNAEWLFPQEKATFHRACWST
jgi:hypothetical protein